MRAGTSPKATLTVRVFRKGQRDPEEFKVPAEIKHPWKNWQRWWWTRVLKRDLPWRGRIPKFTLCLREALWQLL